MTTVAGGALADPHDARRARTAPGLLRPFNDIGVLVAADVHVARRLAALCGEPDDAVMLAAALAVRAPRTGHVYVDLATVHRTASVESDDPVDLAVLPWPDPAAWPAAVAASSLVAEGGPLRLEGSRLYLDRYWREECQIADDLRVLSAPAAVDEAVLADGLDRLFDDADQRLAAERALRRRFAVVAGGPGTGKTWTVARILALLFEQQPERPPLVALAAPTGKAAARMQEVVREQAPKLDAAPAIREALGTLTASTLHKLLKRPLRNPHTRFDHHRHNKLPHDVVIVDETSMVSLTLMARLVEAIRPEARLILVGDPGQLRSIDAGAVLGDLIDEDRPGVTVLGEGHRFGTEIAQLADAIRTGEADRAIALLRAGSDAPTLFDAARHIHWIEADAGDPDAVALAPVRDGALATARAVTAAAREGDAAAALAALGGFRLLCAHRRGPYGVTTWNARVEAWLGLEVGGGRFYPGRPLLVTENDYALRLNNGDTGVIVAADSGVRAAFDDVGLVLPARLSAVETVYAMTIHKGQGSQFETVAVVLPPAGSPLLTRELLYTAVTRARTSLVLAGTEDTIRMAIGRPAERASGLRERLRDL